MEVDQVGIGCFLTLGLLFSPWMQSKEEALQVVHRIFPVFRGLYQDKVANVWCAVNIVIKLRERFAIQDLVRFRYDPHLLLNYSTATASMTITTGR